MGAVGDERISKVVGYLMKAINLQKISPNKPIRIAVFGELNHAQQGTTDITEEWTATTLAKAGERYGYGSPLYHMLRILLPRVGGIPVVVYPQLAAAGATYKTVDIEPAGTATENATHYLRINGRTGLDGQFYSYVVETGDTAAEITAKMSDCVAAVLGAPCTASDDDYSTVLQSKWKGLTANDLTVEIEDGGIPAGITYTITPGSAAAGTPSIADAITALGTSWNTFILNGYGAVTAIMDALEEYNGIPDPENPTGQYTGIIQRPTIALTGSCSEDPSATTDARSDEVTIAMCVAPNSDGFPFEAAANYAALYAPIAQDTPHLDCLNKALPDMPVPTDGNIGAMAEYNERDRIVKDGCSTVELVNGKYQVCDFVTTYHPEGELVPQFRYVRDLIVAMNIRYGYFLLEDQYVIGKVICNDNDIVAQGEIIKPKSWKAVLSDYFQDLTNRALIADPEFSKANLTCEINGSNPARIDTVFRTKLTSVARISATTNELGFNFGSN